MGTPEVNIKNFKIALVYLRNLSQLLDDPMASLMFVLFLYLSFEVIISYFEISFITLLIIVEDQLLKWINEVIRFNFFNWWRRKSVLTLQGDIIDRVVLVSLGSMCNLLKWIGVTLNFRDIMRSVKNNLYFLGIHE